MTGVFIVGIATAAYRLDTGQVEQKYVDEQCNYGGNKHAVRCQYMTHCCAPKA